MASKDVHGASGVVLMRIVFSLHMGDPNPLHPFRHFSMNMLCFS